jgi:hypothetical protein
VEKDLEARISQLEAMAEIMNLEAEYARTWDTNQAEAWADLFAENGAFVAAGSRGRPGQRIGGRDALKRTCQEFNASTTGIHLMYMPRIVVSGDTANGRLSFEFKWVTRRGPQGQTVQGTTSGFYEAEYVRTSKGWRIKERVERPIALSQATFHEV